jgi:hypothetical protein
LDKDFVTAVKKLAAEQGKEALLESRKAKNLLADYTGNRFLRDTGLLLRLLEAGGGKFIADSDAKDLAAVKKNLVKRLEDDFYLSPEPAGEMVDFLGFLLRGDTGRTVTPQGTPPEVQGTAAIQTPAISSTISAGTVKSAAIVQPSAFVNKTPALFTKPVVNLEKINGGVSLTRNMDDGKAPYSPGGPGVFRALKKIIGAHSESYPYWPGTNYPNDSGPSVLAPGRGKFGIGDFIWAKWSGDGNLYYGCITAEDTAIVEIIWHDAICEKVRKEDAYYLEEAFASGYDTVGDYKYSNHFYKCELNDHRLKAVGFFSG